MSLEKIMSESLEESVRTKKAFWEKSGAKLLEVGQLLSNVLARGNKVLAFGNGGSATDSMHFSAELVNRFVKDRAALPAVSLVTDGPLLTCIGNDYSFEQIFERQIAGLGQKGDMALGISTSGNSKNVILGLAEARKRGLVTVALLGGTGGKILEQSLADHVLIVDASRVTARVQETHIWILHSLCEIVDAQR
jgi:D-sedoheptulose 7-phosphate isomerase